MCLYTLEGKAPAAWLAGCLSSLNRKPICVARKSSVGSPINRPLPPDHRPSSPLVVADCRPRRLAAGGWLGPEPLTRTVPRGPFGVWAGLAPGRLALLPSSRAGGCPGHKLISPRSPPRSPPGLRSGLTIPQPIRAKCPRRQAAPVSRASEPRQQAALAYVPLGSSRLSALGFFPPGLVEAAGIEPAFPGRPVWALAGSDHVAPGNPPLPL